MFGSLFAWYDVNMYDLDKLHKWQGSWPYACMWGISVNNWIGPSFLTIAYTCPGANLWYVLSLLMLLSASLLFEILAQLTILFDVMFTNSGEIAYGWDLGMPLNCSMTVCLNLVNPNLIHTQFLCDIHSNNHLVFSLIVLNDRVNLIF